MGHPDPEARAHVPRRGEGMRRLDRDRLEHLRLGATVLGTGGGGSHSLARQIVDDLDRRGLTVELRAIEDLAPEALGVSTAILGGGLTHEALEAMGMISNEPASVKGARALERFLGCPIGFVYPLEIGPQNTLEAIRLAAFLGVPVVDGDCAGRAVPELQQTTLSLHGIPLPPYAVTTFLGDTVLLPEVASDARSEALCRALATASGGVVCVTGFPVRGQRMKDVLIPGTLGLCEAAGALLGHGNYHAERVATRLGGRIAFHGEVRAFGMEAKDGFFRGEVELDGRGTFRGSTYRIGIRNEFMWAWKNNQLDAACPDLICAVDAITGIGKVTYGHGFENSLEVGQALDVLHLPCAPVWQGEQGRSIFPAPPTPSLPPIEPREEDALSARPNWS